MSQSKKKKLQQNLRMTKVISFCKSQVNMEHSSLEKIEFSDFQKVDVRVGTIVAVEEYPEAKKPAYKLEIDFGLLGKKRSSAQITDHYQKDELIGRQVIAVLNFPPKQIGKFLSEVLVLGLPDENQKVVLLEPSFKVPNGGKLF